MAERGEGLIKQEPAEYVKTPETNQESKNAITVQPGHIPGSNQGSDIAIRTTGDRDRKPLDDGVAEESVKLLTEDMYEDVFQYQLLQEQDVMARVSNLGRLAPMEVVVMSGLRLEPPEI